MDEELGVLSQFTVFQMSGMAKHFPLRAPSADGTRSASTPALPRLEDLPDQDLMAQLKRGDQDALTHLFDRYHRLVLSVGLRMLRDPAEAEDLMQETFFEIYRRADKFDPSKGSAKAWIVQFAYNKGLNRRRYLELRKTCGPEQISQLGVLDSYYSPNGSNGLTSEELACMVRQALTTLNRKQREVLELAYFEGLSLTEIADHSKDSLANVRHYYYRGLEKLRDFLQHPSPKGKQTRLIPRKTDGEYDDES